MINNHPLYLIVAADKNYGIGKNGTMPWHLKNELAYFQRVTASTKNPDKQNLVLMGRTTWESIPAGHRPLKGRKNVVLTSDLGYRAADATVCHSLKEGLKVADETVEAIFVIGGGKVFAETMELPELDGVYLTQLDKTFDCDTFFPKIPPRLGTPQVIETGEEGDIRYDCLFYGEKILNS